MTERTRFRARRSGRRRCAAGLGKRQSPSCGEINLAPAACSANRVPPPSGVFSSRSARWPSRLCERSGSTGDPAWRGKADAGEAKTSATRNGAKRRKGADTVAVDVRIGFLLKAYIGIGSNLGDREAVIAAAVEHLRATDGLEVLLISTLRETDPVGYLDQPRFLNGAIAVETSLLARELLGLLLETERHLGRVRGEGPRFGPRTIDLDLLLYGDETIVEPGLQVPHPRLAERRFALEPLAELDPALEIPGAGPVQALLSGLQ